MQLRKKGLSIMTTPLNTPSNTELAKLLERYDAAPPATEQRALAAEAVAAMATANAQISGELYDFEYAYHRRAAASEARAHANASNL